MTAENKDRKTHSYWQYGPDGPLGISSYLRAAVNGTASLTWQIDLDPCLIWAIPALQFSINTNNTTGSRTKDLNSCHWLAVNYTCKWFMGYTVSTTNLSSTIELLMWDIKCVKRYFTIAELSNSSQATSRKHCQQYERDATHSSKEPF